jgi:photosystem II stability/assembly factor-like uncharacterized protein
MLLAMKALAALAAICLLPAIALGQTEKSGPWEMQNSGTTASLRGIHAVGGGVAWASGTNGTVLRTEDSGYMWQSCAMPPGAEKLDFRGIWAWDANTAIVMSSGPGDQSRFYKTTDGCSHWTLLYTNPDKDGFWDAIQFWDAKCGLLLGDPIPSVETPINGKDTQRKKFVLLAASNSALIAIPHFAAFGTGGKAGAFVVWGYGQSITNDCTCGCTPLKHHEDILPFYKTKVPLASGTDASGVFSLAFRDDQHGMVVGGDYTKHNESAGTAAWTTDGGQHWTAATKPPHGYRSSVAWDADAKAWIAAGTNGSDISYDDGKTWQPLDDGNWNALSLPWIVGPKGRIAKLGALPLKK